LDQQARFPGKDALTLMRNADTALYDAKANGRNNFQFFRPEMHARVAERQSMEASLRGAWGGRNSCCIISQR
jgi:predicted signal transduction protein with EAL and GGDEF domain